MEGCAACMRALIEITNQDLLIVHTCIKLWEPCEKVELERKDEHQKANQQVLLVAVKEAEDAKFMGSY